MNAIKQAVGTNFGEMPSCKACSPIVCTTIVPFRQGGAATFLGRPCAVAVRRREAGGMLLVVTAGEKVTGDTVQGCLCGAAREGTD